MRNSVLFWLLLLAPCGLAQTIQKVDPDGVAREPERPAVPNRDILRPKPILAVKGPQEEPVEKLPAPAPAKAVRKDHDFFILPESVSGEPGEWLVITPTVNEAEKVRWKLAKGLKKIPIEKLFPDAKFDGIIVSGKKGVYEVWGWGAKKGEPSDISVCKVYIGVEPGPDPGPGPGPGPDPVPEPTDPLGKSLFDAMKKETAADKVASASALAELYTSAAEQVKASTLPTLGEFNTGLRNARVALIGDKVPLVRAVIHEHISATVPPMASAPLDAAVKGKLSKTFADIAHALRACCP